MKRIGDQTFALAFGYVGSTHGQDQARQRIRDAVAERDALARQVEDLQAERDAARRLNAMSQETATNATRDLALSNRRNAKLAQQVEVLTAALRSAQSFVLQTEYGDEDERAWRSEVIEGCARALPLEEPTQ